jgi:hypothetical protein
MNATAERIAFIVSYINFWLGKHAGKVMHFF